MNGQNETKKRRGWLLPVLALVLAAAVGLGVWQTTQASRLAEAEATATPTYQTSAARIGNVAITVTGTGTVVTSQTVNLGFSVQGEVAGLTVSVGDRVTKGQEIAHLVDTDELEQEVANQKLAVQVAEKNLEDLKAEGTLKLADAYASLTAAQTSLEEAQKNLHQKGDARCAPDLTQEYYFKWLHAKQAADIWEGRLDDPDTGYGRDFILENLIPLRKERDRAYENYTYCQGYTDLEIAESQAALDVAKAELQQAEDTYKTLQASSGIDTEAVAIAEAALKSAELQLVKAEEDLDGATLIAPIDGYVTYLNPEANDVSESDTTSTSTTEDARTFITIADLSNPLVKVYVDEADLQNFAVGCPANVNFDSLTTQTFTGVVTSVSPALVTVQSVGMVEGLVDLNKTDQVTAVDMYLGLTGNVEVTCYESKNVLVIPTLALYEPEGQSPYVYLLDAQGQPVRREVTIGLKTVGTVEITSGLQEGDQVVTTQISEQ